MDAGQQLICKTLDSLETYQSVLNCQKKQSTYFPVSGDHIQLLHDGSCDASRDLVPFVQFKKREKHPWRSVSFIRLQAKPKSRNAPRLSLAISIHFEWQASV